MTRFKASETFLPPLWQHQADAIQASRDALTRGVTRQLIAVPTGGGKSRIAVEIVRERKGRTLFLAHRMELINHMRDHLIASGMPEENVGIEKATQREIDKPVVVASVQTLSHPKRLERLGKGFKTVVVDEAHHATALSYMRIIQRTGAFDDRGPLLVGITATPYRGDQTALDAVFAKKVFEIDIPTLMKRKILCPLRAVQVDLAVDFDKVRKIGGDLSEKDSGIALMAADAPRHVVKAYLANAKGRRTLVFCPTVEVSRAMAAAFNEAKIPAEHLDGTTSATERTSILARLRSGKTKVVSNCAVLGEGFDEPLIECVIIARPTLSPLLFAQMIGRGCRVAPSKDDCLVIDAVGASRRHNLVTTASFFGLQGHEATLEDEGVLAAIGERAEREEHDGKLRQRVVDLFRETKIGWHPIGADVFGLSLGSDHGNVYLRGDNNEWDIVWLKPRGVDRFGRKTFRTKVLHEGLDLEEAQELGEAFAEEKGARTLIARDAQWHHKRISEGQLRWGKAIPQLRRDMTMGEASKLITPFALRKAWNRWAA